MSILDSIGHVERTSTGRFPNFSQNLPSHKNYTATQTVEDEHVAAVLPIVLSLDSGNR